MYLRENPVLQRELLVNLRMPRAFVLMLVYQMILGAVIYFAWPQETRLDLTKNPESTRKLVDLFFIGQYILASLMAPSFAAGAISGEKERKTYEMLLASPLQPSAIVLGKLFASLAHLAVLIFASLPIVMLCLPLGGVSIYEVLAAYLGLILSVVCFGMISVLCSSIFRRTSASLLVSYLTILPLALIGVSFWRYYTQSGDVFTALKLIVGFLPGIAGAFCIVLFYLTGARLLRPPDVGSEGKDVVDLDEEAREAIGLVIQPDKFPDKLFAPPKRNALMNDGVNPVYDKEIRSEIFASGTLMLRLVIQVSMFLAVIFMALWLYLMTGLASWYVGFVIIFNVLVGPVFSAGSITSERERQTLDLLLTTTITPWQILWGKLIAGLRVSSVLTFFLVWPIILAAFSNPEFWFNELAVLAYMAIILLTCLTTAMIALFCSAVNRKTTNSLITTYSVILILFCLPGAATFFSDTFFPDHPSNKYLQMSTVCSPFSAASNVPLYTTDKDNLREKVGDGWFGYQRGVWQHFLSYVAFTLGMNLMIFLAMTWMFRSRWRIAASSE
jgi:ABC-type transport system involved in multi-copper enzyme maturation permease subunit